MLDRLALFALAPLTFASSLFELPAAAVPDRSFGASIPTAGGGFNIARGVDGLFYVPVKIGTETFNMALDTGASRSVMPRRLLPHGVVPRGGSGRIETLDGSVPFQQATLKNVSIGSKHFSSIDVAVADIDFPAPLLGQDLIRQLGPVTIDRDTLTLR